MVTATSIKIDESLKSRIQHLANVQQRSSHWIMRKALYDYVDREEKREAFRRDTLLSWKEYEETGLHLTFEEVDDWMAKLEAGENPELPECHR